MKSKEKILNKVIEVIKEKPEDLILYIQPIYSVSKAKFNSAEVLVRIQDENHMIMPDVFIPIAEENHLIEQLDELIFKKVCIFLKNNNVEKYGIDYLEVNLSVLSLEIEDASGRYLSFLKRYKIPSKLLNIEITETANISNIEMVQKNVRKFREAGIALSLDDFGNGKRAIRDIREIPVDIVKFDATMINACYLSEHVYHIITMLIRMIHELGMKVVAEGVENKKMFDRMDQAKVDYIQGFYLSRPITVEEFLYFLQKSANLVHL